MKCFWLLLCVVVLCGCDRNANPQSNGKAADITLGRGFTNQLELGMTLRDVKRLRPDLVIDKGDDKYYGHVPVLGAGFLLKNRSAEIQLIEVAISTNTFGEAFRGRITGRLSFEKGEPVSRNDITKAFGQLDQAEGQDVGKKSQSRTDFLWKSDVDTDILFYWSQGISFKVVKDRVTSINLFYPNRKGSASE